MYPKPSIVSDNGVHLFLKFSVVSDNNKYLFQELNIVLIDNRYIAQSFVIISINNEWDFIYLSLSETLINTLIRYLVLSETTVLAYTRNYPLFRTIRDSHIFRLLAFAYNIDLPIVSNENGKSYGDSWSIRSSLAGCLWGVCITPLHGYVYLIDGWYRCAYV